MFLIKTIYKDQYFYFIYTNNCRCFYIGDSIAKDLKITIENFQSILKKYGADHNGDFKNKKDIENCIKELETYEIMNKLCE